MYKKSSKSPLVAALIVLLFLPLNAGAAPWMAMSDHEQANEIVQNTHKSHTSHSQHSIMGHAMQIDVQNDHKSEDCDEYCVSCVNHCSSSAITVTSTDFLHQIQLPISSRSAGILARIKLIYRPPIHS